MSSDFNLGEVRGIVSQIDQRLGKLEEKLDSFVDAAHKARHLWEAEQSAKAEHANFKTNIMAGSFSAVIAGAIGYFWK